MTSCSAGQLFRNYLVAHDFIEIHTPKLLAGANEGEMLTSGI